MPIFLLSKRTQSDIIWLILRGVRYMNPDEEYELLNNKFNRMERKWDKLDKILGSFGISMGGANLLSLAVVGLTNPTTYLVTAAIIGAIAWPTLYITASKLSQKSKEKEAKRLRCLNQAFLMLQEDSCEKDQVITQKTTNFYKKVENMLKKDNYELDSQSINFVNDLLYLINANYYQEVEKYLPYLKREQLLDKVMDQVGNYLEKTQKKKLTNNDIVNILNGCFFLKNPLKEEIAKEYIESTAKFGTWIEHGIKNRTVDTLDIENYRKEKNQEVLPTAIFDIENIDDYQTIIQGIIAKDQYLSNFGDTNSLTWDMKSLQNIICIIAKDHRRQLLEAKDEYCNFDLTVSFIYNAMCYGIMNHKNEIGQKELLATFREWNYLPFELRATIASDIIEKQALEANLHPFYKTKPKEKTKVIPISSIKKD